MQILKKHLLRKRQVIITIKKPIVLRQLKIIMVKSKLLRRRIHLKRVQVQIGIRILKVQVLQRKKWVLKLLKKEIQRILVRKQTSIFLFVTKICKKLTKNQNK